MIGDYLKRADKFILQQDFESAEREVAKAIDIDPNNLYALAYMERVKHFRDQSKTRPPQTAQEEASQTSAPYGVQAVPAPAPAEQPHAPTVFLVDDEPDYLNLLDAVLSGAGYRVVSADSPENAIRQLQTITPDLILCDMNFENSKLNGLSIYENVRLNPKMLPIPFVFITGVKDDEVIRATMEKGADDLIAKPFSSDMLLALVEGKIKRFRELREMSKQ